MLAAGNGKDHPGAPVYRLLHCIIRSHVTGMEGNHHICMVCPFIGSNISMIKTKVLIAVALTETIALVNHILL